MKTRPDRSVGFLSSLLLLFLMLPAVAQAQFTFTTNNGAITITGYTGSGGAVAIPSTTNGYPVTGIGQLAFIECGSLTILTIPGSVTNIGAAAFALCTNLTGVAVADTVTNPGGLNLGGLAFALCTNLTSAYFGGNIPTDDGTAFSGDPAAVVYYEMWPSNWGATFGGAPTEPTTPPSDFECNTYDGSFTIIGYNGLERAVVIPAFINGNSVTSIQGGPDGVVGDASSVTIPNTVTNIGSSAFFQCNSLTNIVIPDSVTSIGDSAFENCDRLTNIIIPGSVASIGQSAFQYCTSLTNIVIPSSVTSIGQSAFANCTSLRGVTIPNSVTSIGDGAFGFTSLVNMVIPSSVTNIGEAAFDDCASLTNISVATANTAYSSLNGVLFDKAQDTLIAYPAGLKNRTYTIPDSVTNIGNYAFRASTNLTFAYFLGNAPPDDGTAFYGDPYTVVYYLPGTTGWGASFGAAPAELWNPQATAFTTPGGPFGFNFTGPTNATIGVEACTNLANPVWLPVSTNTLSGSGTSSFSDPQWMNYPNRYYRFSAP